MTSRTNYQKGFTAVEGLLIIVVVNIVSFTGWYVWHSQQNANKILTAKSSQSQSTTWKTYSDAADKFTISYPDSWTVSSSNSKTGTPFANRSEITFKIVIFKSNPNPISLKGQEYSLYITNDSLNEFMQIGENNLNSNSFTVNYKTSNIVINKRPAIHVIASYGAKTLSDDTYIEASGLTYDFESAMPPNNGQKIDPIATRMLQTLMINN